MQYPLRQSASGTPGSLGLGQAIATRIYCGFYVFYYTIPILAAIVADSYIGRYATLVASASLYGLGCIVLTISSLTQNAEKGWGIPGLGISLFLIGLGAGSFRAIVVPFIADQQPRMGPTLKTLRSGEQVVIDYHITLHYVYNFILLVSQSNVAICARMVTDKLQDCEFGIYV